VSNSPAFPCKAVNENHRSPCGIEWLQLSQSGRVRVLCGFITPANPSRSGRSRAINNAVGALRSMANGKVRLPIATRSVFIGSTNSNSARLSANLITRRNRCVNTTKLKLLARPRIFYATYSNQRRTDSAYRRTRFEELTADFQAVDRKQIVSARIVFLINRLRSRKKIACLIDSY